MSLMKRYSLVGMGLELVLEKVICRAYHFLGGWAANPTFMENLHNNLKFDNSRSRAILGLKYEPLGQTVKETIDSMISTGWIKPKL